MVKFDPIYLILLLAGTEPIHESPKTSWWKKLNKIGILFCIIQLTLTILGYIKESGRSGATGHFTNNIMRLTIINKQMFTIIVPILYNGTKFYHLKELEMFHQKVSQFDEMIRITSRKIEHRFKGDLERIQKTSDRLRILSAVLLILGEALNIWIGAVYIIRTTKEPPQVVTFYFYQVTVVNFIGAALDIGIKLSGVKWRLQLVVDLEKKIVKSIVKKELDKKGIRLLFKE